MACISCVIVWTSKEKLADIILYKTVFDVVRLILSALSSYSSVANSVYGFCNQGIL